MEPCGMSPSSENSKLAFYCHYHQTSRSHVHLRNTHLNVLTSWVMGEEVYEQIKLYKKVDWMMLVHQLF